MVAIHNTTDLDLTLIEYNNGSYGSDQLRVPAGKKKKVPHGSRLIEGWGSSGKEIHIMSSERRLLMVLRSSDLENREGKHVWVGTWFECSHLLVTFCKGNPPPVDWMYNDGVIWGKLDKEAWEKLLKKEEKKNSKKGNRFANCCLGGCLKKEGEKENSKKENRFAICLSGGLNTATLLY